MDDKLAFLVAAIGALLLGGGERSGDRQMQCIRITLEAGGGYRLHSLAYSPRLRRNLEQVFSDPKKTKSFRKTNDFFLAIFKGRNKTPK